MADLTRLPVVDDSIDLLWCHHVLEHIGDDRAAMRELHRILHPVTGELVVSVPMIPGTITCEYGFPKKEESGHWRIYGDDFVDRLTESGLTVERVKYSVLKGLQYGITSEENFYICRKAPSARSTLSLNRPAAAGPEGCLYS